jgi:hypothetical protein
MAGTSILDYKTGASITFVKWFIAQSPVFWFHLKKVSVTYEQKYLEFFNKKMLYLGFIYTG